MESIVKQQQPTHPINFDTKQNKLENETTMNSQKPISTRDNFPSGLRGGGPCFDCLACLFCCCAIEDIACFECCKDC